MSCILLGVIVVLSEIKDFNSFIPTAQLIAYYKGAPPPYIPPGKHIEDVIPKFNTFLDFYNDPSYLVQQSLGCITVTWTLFLL